MSPFPKKKFPPKPGIGILPAKPKPSLDDLESPDPVEGKPAPDPEEAGESPDEESGEDDYSAKLIAPLVAAGMDAAGAKSALAHVFSTMADYMGGDDSGQGADAGGAGMPGDDSAY